MTLQQNVEIGIYSQINVVLQNIMFSHETD